VNACLSNPCRNNATCSTDPSNAAVFRCQCVNGFTGTTCAAEGNVAPSAIIVTPDFIPENLDPIFVALQLSAVDANVNDSHTFSLVSDPSGLFTVVGNNLRVGAVLDFESVSSYRLTLRATDNAPRPQSFDQEVLIEVDDVNDVPSCKLVA
jgi:hypothetical protein